MFLIILLIYFIILIFLEFIYILLSKNNDKQFELFNIIEQTIDNDNDNKKILMNNMTLIESNEDVDIKNFIGKIYLDNYYGFFINLDQWNLINAEKIYQFNAPVNIKILKLKVKENIKYYINK